MTILIFILVAFAISIGAAEVARAMGAPVFVTRKIAHVLGGCVAATLPFAVSQRAAISMAAFFCLLIFVAGRFGTFDSIDAKGKNGHGALFFPLGLSLPIIFFWDTHPFLVPLAALMLAFADGLAGLAGEAFGRRAYYTTGRKTIEGTLCCFGAALLLFLGFLVFADAFTPWSILGAVGAAVVIASIEAIAGQGTDNVVIPFAAALLGKGLLLL